METSEMNEEQRAQRRKYNRAAKQKQREGEKQKRDRALAAVLEADWADRINAQGMRERAASGRCFLGEVEPGRDATTIAEALRSCREFARALGSADVQQGETLYDFERRIFHDWTHYDKFRSRYDCQPGGGGAPFLNRQTQQLSPGWGRDYFEEYCGGFDECWKSLPGSKKQIDIATLPPLPPVLTISEPELETTTHRTVGSPMPTADEVSKALKRTTLGTRELLEQQLPNYMKPFDREWGEHLSEEAKAFLRGDTRLGFRRGTWSE